MLLITKFYIPPARPKLVSRPHLIERLNAGLHGKLVLVSAPAGFGKTTLLGEWARQVKTPVAWLSLEKGDDDPERFLTYIVGALQTVHENVGEDALQMSHLPQPLPAMPEARDELDRIETILTSLVNELAAIPTALVLVLDDYHVIQDQLIHYGLTFLLDHLPPQMHIVIAGRVTPALPLARWRARGQLAELQADDLRFRPDEAAVFLTETMDLNLSPGDIERLQMRTEGWVAGLQMAALTSRGTAWSDLSGDHRYIMDYLIQEVLDQQPQAIQSFLLQTAILERLSGSLCSAVTGNDQSQKMLQTLERRNLFIIPLDNRRHWYRYHHLFSELLRHHLEQQARPRTIASLHRRAAVWYEQNALVPDAINHALAARDFELAARLIEAHAETMLQRGEIATLFNWLDTLPPEMVRDRPFLCVVKAWALLIRSQFTDAERCARDAESAADLSARIRGHINAIRATVAINLGDSTRAIALSQQALENLPPDEVLLKGVIALNLGDSYVSLNNVPAAQQAFSEAIAINKQDGNIFVTLASMGGLGALYAGQGDLHQAAKAYRQAIQLGTERGQRGMPVPMTGTSYTLLAWPLYHWNDLDGALDCALNGVECCRRWGHFRSLTNSYRTLAYVQQARGAAAAARDAVEKARHVVETKMAVAWPVTTPDSRDQIAWAVRQLEALQAHLWLVQGDVDAVARWAEERQLQNDEEHPYLVLPRLYLAQNRPDEASRLLTRLLPQAESNNRVNSMLSQLALQVRAFYDQGNTTNAIETLERALFLAERGGYIRIFLDQGTPMEKLLRRAAARGVAPAYVKKMLAAFERDHQLPVADRFAVPLIEPLSERELEVLHLIAAGLSNPAIADTLVVSVNTVKTHVKRLYGKLGVNSRLQAVERARELDLL
jgi:LuxR family maltose regulon positive regulatory protein